MLDDQKLLERVMLGTSDDAIAFEDLCHLLRRLGFEEYTEAEHHLFRKAGVEEKINVQQDGDMAQMYQVCQVRDVILKYKLGGELHA